MELKGEKRTMCQIYQNYSIYLQNINDNGNNNNNNRISVLAPWQKEGLCKCTETKFMKFVAGISHRPSVQHDICFGKQQLMSNK